MDDRFDRSWRRSQIRERVLRNESASFKATVVSLLEVAGREVEFMSTSDAMQWIAFFGSEYRRALDGGRVNRIEASILKADSVIDELLVGLSSGRSRVGFQESPAVVLEIEQSTLTGTLLISLLKADRNTVFVCGPGHESLIIDLISDPEAGVSIESWRNVSETSTDT